MIAAMPAYSRRHAALSRGALAAALENRGSGEPICEESVRIRQPTQIGQRP